MTTSSSENSLITKCHYMQADRIYCERGYLYQWRKFNHDIDTDGVISEAVTLEGHPLQCPACEGKSVILTDRGREMMTFLDVFARPYLRDLVDELFEEREQR